MTAETKRIVEAPHHVDIESRDEFGDRVAAVISSMPPGGALVVDFAGTEFVDTAGLSTLATIHVRATDAQLSVQLINVNEEICVSLELARLHELFEIDPVDLP